MYEPRLAAVIATPALPYPNELFAGAAKQEAETVGAAASEVAKKPSGAGRREPPTFQNWFSGGKV